MMKRNMIAYYSLRRVSKLLLLSMALMSIGVQAEEPPTLTENGVITGTMDIAFETRTKLDNSGKYEEGSPALGVKDKYTLNLNVANTTEFSGLIERQPQIKVKVVGVEAQTPALLYDVTLAVLNPADLSQKKTVGKWIGSLPMEGNNYNIDAGKTEGSALRIAVDTVGAAQGFTDTFGGLIVGKPQKTDNWKEKLSAFSFERILGNKKVKIEATETDPLTFKNVKLAKGPSSIYPSTVVNGRLVYDYETGNWYTDGVTFKYNLNGTDYEDSMTGSIKWIEDPDRSTNGKGQYEFNLRFNEDKMGSATTEAAAFAEMSDEEAFFAVDNSLPAMTGRIDFVDTMIPGKEAPSASHITYNLHANKLTKQQIMNFFKLWLLAVGPVNDE